MFLPKLILSKIGLIQDSVLQNYLISYILENLHISTGFSSLLFLFLLYSYFIHDCIDILVLVIFLGLFSYEFGAVCISFSHYLELESRQNSHKLFTTYFTGIIAYYIAYLKKNNVASFKIRL